jgi:putative spermidine/putrescine transport system ATP-binding protein
MAMAGHIAVMREGKVVQFGTPEAIYTDPANAWVGDFIGSGNLLPGKVVDGRDGLIMFEAGGELRFDVARRGPVPDSPVLFFRAEQVALAEPTPGMTFTVAARRFLGNSVELHLDAGGTVVRAIVPSAIAGPYPLGTVTGIKLDASDCRLLPAGDAAAG